MFEPGVAIDVASFTDAWIETIPSPSSCLKSKVASFTDAWIETIQITETMVQRIAIVASFTDAWIETIPLLVHR